MVRPIEEERVYGETRSDAIHGLGPRSPVRHAAATDGSPWPMAGLVGGLAPGASAHRRAESR
jgi:hypothetical protein